MNRIESVTNNLESLLSNYLGNSSGILHGSFGTTFEATLRPFIKMSCNDFCFPPKWSLSESELSGLQDYVDYSLHPSVSFVVLTSLRSNVFQSFHLRSGVIRFGLVILSVFWFVESDYYYKGLLANWLTG